MFIDLNAFGAFIVSVTNPRIWTARELSLA